MRLSRRMLLLAVPGLFAAACLSPTLPLPPPAVPTVTQIGQGQYELSGRIDVPGAVLVLNLRTRVIRGEDVQDVYHVPVVALPGDSMSIWYDSGNDKSGVTTFVIEEALAQPDARAPVVDAGKD